MPRVSVYPGPKERDWSLYRKIGNYAPFNPDIKEEDKKVNEPIFSDICDFMEFNDWQEHRMALLTILQENNGEYTTEDFDNLRIHNYELLEKIRSDKVMKREYKKYYGNIFHDFDSEIPKEN